MERLYAPWRMAYVDQPGREAAAAGCIFCDKASQSDDNANLIVHRGLHAFVLLNLFPYNNGHLMVAPYQHTADLSVLDDAATFEIMALVKQAQAALQTVCHPQGYNVGMNLGAAAGAGIADHLHLHIVPRWHGDTNFMPVLGDVKVLPDSLARNAEQLRRAWPASVERG